MTAPNREFEYAVAHVNSDGTVGNYAPYPVRIAAQEAADWCNAGPPHEPQCYVVRRQPSEWERVPADDS